MFKLLEHLNSVTIPQRAHPFAPYPPKSLPRSMEEASPLSKNRNFSPLPSEREARELSPEEPPSLSHPHPLSKMEGEGQKSFGWSIYMLGRKGRGRIERRASLVGGK
ncbi:hypothetical protein CDAR_513371 [Caerostris darwini]|uniref:Uncharacterized protein n=1 Tax=Caerostris darwini TaxID=1538125 RepID=A0AAV4WVG4_9ARAC|nr:hypothetical protein CDAR_513371 [Caerostris darwini]